MTCKLKTHASRPKNASHRVPGSSRHPRKAQIRLNTIHQKLCLIYLDFRINVYTSPSGGSSEQPRHELSCRRGGQRNGLLLMAPPRLRDYLRRLLIPIQFTSSDDYNDVPLTPSSDKMRGSWDKTKLCGGCTLLTKLPPAPLKRAHNYCMVSSIPTE